MSNKSISIVGRCLSALVVAILFIAGNQAAVKADSPADTSYLYVTEFDCANFSFSVGGNPGNGYVGVRIWINNPNGPSVFDSYTGHPSYFAPIVSGLAQGAVTFTPQPIGTTLWARVYRAPSPVSGSWDGGAFVETSVTCNKGINRVLTWGLTCSNFLFTGSAYPGSGYAAVRIWKESPLTTLVDSYVAGYPEYYTKIGLNGAFSGSVNFGPQPVGTKILARLYRALSPAPNSWDGGAIVDLSLFCNTP